MRQKSRSDQSAPPPTDAAPAPRPRAGRPPRSGGAARGRAKAPPEVRTDAPIPEPQADRRRELAAPQPKPPAEPAESVAGVLEIGHRGAGYLRDPSQGLAVRATDPFVPAQLIQRHALRPGAVVIGTVGRGRNPGERQIVAIERVERLDPAEAAKLPAFERGTVITPDRWLRLESPGAPVAMRIIDLFSPIGRGQRALIVAPPRSGKTVLLKDIATALGRNYPSLERIVLLVDERPEEVTDFRRSVTGVTVFASSNDEGAPNHVRLAMLAMEVAKRRVEAGADVVVLLDSLTRLGRAFNAAGPTSGGRTMSGGLDTRAMEIPKRIFGAARQIEGGGSLTVLATALIETNSRMDEVIFEEFKGTGNMELVLERKLAEERIFPALNLPKSGTRNEELLWGSQTYEYQAVRRALTRLPPIVAMQRLLEGLSRTATNDELIANVNRVLPSR